MVAVSARGRAADTQADATKHSGGKVGVLRLNLVGRLIMSMLMGLTHSAIVRFSARRVIRLRRATEVKNESKESTEQA
jgi:hypothetical protein